MNPSLVLGKQTFNNWCDHRFSSIFRVYSPFKTKNQNIGLNNKDAFKLTDRINLNVCLTYIFSAILSPSSNRLFTLPWMLQKFVLVTPFETFCNWQYIKACNLYCQQIILTLSRIYWINHCLLTYVYNYLSLILTAINWHITCMIKHQAMIALYKNKLKHVPRVLVSRGNKLLQVVTCPHWQILTTIELII